MIIDGRELAREREQLLKTRVDQFIQKTGRKPMLIAVELSDDPGSQLYLKLKKAVAERVGIKLQVTSLRPELRSSTPRLRLEEPRGYKLQVFRDFVADGIFIQHPPGYDKKKWQEFVDHIPPEKDVDCLTTTNLQLIKEGKPRFLPATVKAVGYCLVDAFRHSGGSAAPDRISTDQMGEILSLEDSLQDDIKDKCIVVLGRSPIIGLPLSYWLKNLGGNVSLLHSQTSSHELRATCQRADILISTIGKPGIVTGDMVKEGVIVVDAGSPKGDVVFSEVAPKAFAITPVPGGVGPLTVVSLMENVVQSIHLTGREGS